MTRGISSDETLPPRKVASEQNRCCDTAEMDYDNDNIPEIDSKERDVEMLAACCHTTAPNSVLANAIEASDEVPIVSCVTPTNGIVLGTILYWIGL